MADEPLAGVEYHFPVVVVGERALPLSDVVPEPRALEVVQGLLVGHAVVDGERVPHVLRDVLRAALLS